RAAGRGAGSPEPSLGCGGGRPGGAGGGPVRGRAARRRGRGRPRQAGRADQRAARGSGRGGPAAEVGDPRARGGPGTTDTRTRQPNNRRSRCGAGVITGNGRRPGRAHTSPTPGDDVNLKDQLDALLDATAFDSTGTKIGAVRQVYVDDTSGKMTFAT